MQLVNYREQFVEKDTRRSYDLVAKEHGAGVDFVSLAAGCMAVKGTCSVLDICCGNSTFLVDLQEQVPGIEITGVDMYPIDKRNTPRDKRLKRQNDVISSCNSMPMLPDNSYDIIASTWGASYYGRQGGFVNLPSTYISEIGRLLSAGGTASVTPEHLGGGFRVEHLLASDDKKLAHIKLQSPFTWRKAVDYRQLADAGFSLRQDTEKLNVVIEKP